MTLFELIDEYNKNNKVLKNSKVYTDLITPLFDRIGLINWDQNYLVSSFKEGENDRFLNEHEKAIFCGENPDKYIKIFKLPGSFPKNLIINRNDGNIEVISNYLNNDPHQYEKPSAFGFLYFISTNSEEDYNLIKDMHA